MPEGENPPAILPDSAPAPTEQGWSCGRFPCEDDIAGWQSRITVPTGFQLSYVGQLLGQPQQVTYGPDGQLYATVHQNGTTQGAVAVMNPETGDTDIYSSGYVSPVGLAFQPGTSVLYVSARETVTSGGVIYRVSPGGGSPTPGVTGLPCCWREIDNQVNGMTFGPDGLLYVGVSSLTDRAEPPNPDTARFADIQPLEASVLQVNPHTATVESYAQGIRHPFDVTVDRNGQFYTADSGTLSGVGDRVLALMPSLHHGFPYWRSLGCTECPSTRQDLDYAPTLLSLPPYTLPRGLTAYTGQQFPANIVNNLFVALWQPGTVIRVDPSDVPTDPEEKAAYSPPVFVSGLARPVDVTVAPDGALIIADQVYGHIWQVSYTG